MTQNDLNNKTTVNNASTDFHTINLLKYIPKLDKNQKLTNNKFHSIKDDKKLKIYTKNSYHKLVETKIKQNTASLIRAPDIRYLNNISIIKDSTLPTSKENNISHKKKSIPSKNSEFNSIDKLKTKSKKDPVIAFFNRNFYSCEVPISKKILDSRKTLDYYLKDNEAKDKFKQLLKIKRGSYSKRAKSLIMKQNSYKKYDIKKSLMLNDFRVYNRIHQVVRFWSRFVNYACPIFQVQKFTLNSQKYRDENRNNNNSSMENLNKICLNDKNVKLPKLYTNSSKIFKTGEIKENKFFRRNKSKIDRNSFKHLKLNEEK